jgi:hypothetical protein
MGFYIFNSVKLAIYKKGIVNLKTKFKITFSN